MTCIVNVNGANLRDDLRCSLDIPHQGALIRVKLPCAGTWAKRGEGVFFEGGVLTGDYWYTHRAKRVWEEPGNEATTA